MKTRSRNQVIRDVSEEEPTLEKEVETNQFYKCHSSTQDATDEDEDYTLSSNHSNVKRRLKSITRLIIDTSDDEIKTYEEKVGSSATYSCSDSEMSDEKDEHNRVRRKRRKDNSSLIAENNSETEEISSRNGAGSSATYSCSDIESSDEKDKYNRVRKKRRKDNRSLIAEDNSETEEISSRNQPGSSATYSCSDSESSDEKDKHNRVRRKRRKDNRSLIAEDNSETEEISSRNRAGSSATYSCSHSESSDEKDKHNIIERKRRKDNISLIAEENSATEEISSRNQVVSSATHAFADSTTSDDDDLDVLISKQSRMRREKRRRNNTKIMAGEISQDVSENFEEKQQNVLASHICSNCKIFDEDKVKDLQSKTKRVRKGNSNKLIAEDTCQDEYGSVEEGIDTSASCLISHSNTSVEDEGYSLNTRQNKVGINNAIRRRMEGNSRLVKGEKFEDECQIFEEKENQLVLNFTSPNKGLDEIHNFSFSNNRFTKRRKKKDNRRFVINDSEDDCNYDEGVNLPDACNSSNQSTFIKDTEDTLHLQQVIPKRKSKRIVNKKLFKDETGDDTVNVKETLNKGQGLFQKNNIKFKKPSTDIARELFPNEFQDKQAIEDSEDGVPVLRNDHSQETPLKAACKNAQLNSNRYSKRIKSKLQRTNNFVIPDRVKTLNALCPVSLKKNCSRLEDMKMKKPSSSYVVGYYQYNRDQMDILQSEDEMSDFVDDSENESEESSTDE